MDIVCFFTVVPDKDPTEYYALFSLMAASARRAIPGARIVVLTDQDSVIPDRLPHDVVFRSSGSNDDLMIAKLRAWRDYLRDTDYGNTVFIDPDVLVQRNPEVIFDGSADLMVTWRFSGQPVNAGVLFVDGRGDRAMTVNFFDRCLEVAESLSAEDKTWGADQIALAAVTRLGEFGRTPPERLTLSGIRVRVLPCKMFNYSEPKVNRLPVLKPAPQPYFLHFKGIRKIVMRDFSSSILGMKVKDDPKAPGRIKVFPNQRSR